MVKTANKTANENYYNINQTKYTRKATTKNNEENYMIQNLHLLPCYRSCLVANKLHEVKRTNIRNYTRQNYTAKTAPNYDEQYG